MSNAATLTVELPAERAELAESMLHDAGCLGLEVRDGDTLAMPGQRAPQPGHALLVAYFDGEEEAASARAELAESLDGADFEVATLEAQDWSESWKARIKATVAGRLWVGPPWLLAEAPERAIKIIIEPGMAFGTGDHATTQFCLEALDHRLAERHGQSVLDVGTGSAVLAIAARKLGAGRVVGTDNDPVAVRVAQENASKNDVHDLELAACGLEAVTGTFDLVLANILANTLCELAPAIVPKLATRGRLVLAGILGHQADEVLAVYLAQGLVLRRRVLRTESAGLPEAPMRTEWAMLELERA